MQVGGRSGFALSSLLMSLRSRVPPHRFLRAPARCCRRLDRHCLLLRGERLGDRVRTVVAGLRELSDVREHRRRLGRLVVVGLESGAPRRERRAPRRTDPHGAACPHGHRARQGSPRGRRPTRWPLRASRRPGHGRSAPVRSHPSRHTPTRPRGSARPTRRADPRPRRRAQRRSTCARARACARSREHRGRRATRQRAGHRASAGRCSRRSTRSEDSAGSGTAAPSVRGRSGEGRGREVRTSRSKRGRAARSRRRTRRSGRSRAWKWSCPGVSARECGSYVGARARRSGRAHSRAASRRPSCSPRRGGAASRRARRGTARARSRR